MSDRLNFHIFLLDEFEGGEDLVKNFAIINTFLDPDIYLV